MAMFSTSSSPDGSGHSTARGGGGEGSLSIIAPGTKVVGEIETDGVVKFEGRFEGTVRAQRQVLVAKDGVIAGDIYTREAVVGGKVIGSIFADERVEIQVNSSVQGDIVSPRLTVQEGGEVNGNVRMTNPKALERPAKVELGSSRPVVASR